MFTSPREPKESGPRSQIIFSVLPQLKPVSSRDPEISHPNHRVYARNALTQVRVFQMEGLDELSWGNLEGKDSKSEPSKARLATLKGAWDDGDFDR